MPTNAVFFEAAAILLREGLEAILVPAALAAYLTRAEGKNPLKMLWPGAAAALVISGGAAWAFEHFYNDAHNDIFEGLIIFVAAMLLFYVSGWLFLRQNPRVWKNYLKKQTGRALSANSAWLVAALAFFAVVREGVDGLHGLSPEVEPRVCKAVYPLGSTPAARLSPADFPAIINKTSGNRVRVSDPMPFDCYLSRRRDKSMMSQVRDECRPQRVG